MKKYGFKKLYEEGLSIKTPLLDLKNIKFSLIKYSVKVFKTMIKDMVGEVQYK